MAPCYQNMCLLKVTAFLLLTGLAHFGRNASAIEVFNITAHPGSVQELVMDTNTSVGINGYVYLSQKELKSGLILCSQVDNLDVARPLNQVCNNQTIDLEPTSAWNNETLPTNINSPANSLRELYFLNGSFYLHGVLLGRTNVEIYANVGDDDPGAKKTGTKVVLIETYSVTVIRNPRILDHIFTGTIAVIVIVINIGFGCMIDLKVVKDILKKPIVPVLGLCCQYIINPLIAYGLLKVLSLNTSFAFGMFAFGCSPSGSASNAWTVILKGDLDLSLFITFVSTIAALGMMPLWLFTLGKTLVKDTIKIPYTNIMISLVSLIVPVLIGVIIHRWLPKTSRFLRRLVKPASVLFLVYVCTFGMYVNAFMFKLIDWKIVVAGLVMPCCTFSLGALVARMCGLSYKSGITIAIETAIQNTGIAFVMMLATLPKPDGDIAAIMPVIGSIFTPLPLLAVLIGSYVHGRCSGTKKENTLMISENVNNKNNKISNDPLQNNNFIDSHPT